MEHTVGSAEDGMILRSVLRGAMRMSYTALKNAKWNGEITVDGQQSNVDRIVHAGQVIRVTFPESEPVYHPTPWEHPIPVLWQDEHLMVVDKPAPMASQSSARQSDHTLENAICAMSDDPDRFIYRPVNRLDKGTSGLMVVARTAHAQQLLQRLLHSADFVRRYLAIVEGCP